MSVTGETDKIFPTEKETEKKKKLRRQPRWHTHTGAIVAKLLFLLFPVLTQPTHLAVVITRYHL